MAKGKSLNMVLTIVGIAAIGVGIYYLIKKKIKVTIGSVGVVPYNATPGDQISMSASVLNNGDKPITVLVGCSIQSPNGTYTDSKDFCCGSWSGTICSSLCNTPYKQITLSAGQIQSVSFTETLGPNTTSGIHTVYMAVWEGYDSSTGLMKGKLVENVGYVTVM